MQMFLNVDLCREMFLQLFFFYSDYDDCGLDFK